ncbi:655_t:CDS:1 [Racocetra fulgida]|uniref:655_t:CDS:1 n=1 Tax=Racocetra fulgida TaxID=60492 RepID=A0A9N9DMK3_9GLOM|nr:655_t:CDS:1 [Racocetra fulgida]
MIYDGLRPIVPTNAPKLIKDLITKCWNDQPDKRPTSKEIFDIINTWNSNTLSDISTKIVKQISSDESNENILESNQSIPAHFKIHSKAIYTSRKFAPLSCTNDINSDRSNHIGINIL